MLKRSLTIIVGLSLIFFLISTNNNLRETLYYILSFLTEQKYFYWNKFKKNKL